MRIQAMLAPADYEQLAPGAKFHIPEGASVVTADGQHIGTVLRAWTDDGALYADLDVDDEEEGVGCIYATTCPYCEKLCLAGASNEIEHMNREHSDVIRDRLIDAGFEWDEAQGCWVDTKTTED